MGNLIVLVEICDQKLHYTLYILFCRKFFLALIGYFEVTFITSNNETVSCQNMCASNMAKSMTSEGNSALLPANVDQRPPFQRGLMNFQLQNFQLYITNHFKTGPSVNSSIFCSP